MTGSVQSSPVRDGSFFCLFKFDDQIVGIYEIESGMMIEIESLSLSFFLSFLLISIIDVMLKAHPNLSFIRETEQRAELSRAGPANRFMCGFDDACERRPKRARVLECRWYRT